MFWYHQQGQRPHELPDARSDVKGRTLLRRIRSGYAVISPIRTPEATSPRAESIAEPDATPTITEEDEPEQQHQQQQHGDEDHPPATPPSYATAAANPPPYAQPVRPSLPPALPGYTPLPGILGDDDADQHRSARDLVIQPVRRRSYRDALRRRLTSTRKLLLPGDDASSTCGSDADSLCDSASARGVVLYRGDNDRWIGTGASSRDVDKADVKAEPRRGFRGWLKRTWASLVEFMDEHPYLYILAIFVIVVVVMCLVI